MSELHANEQVAPWLEMELTRRLEPVAAPDSLWDRLQERPVLERVDSFRWGWWPVAAALLVMISGGAVWRIEIARNRAGSMERLAEQELRRLAAGAQEFDLRSQDPLEIRNWVKAKVNIDIELPRKESTGTVRLLGARLLRLNGAPVAAVAYKVENECATLLVSRKDPGGNAITAKHLTSRLAPSGGGRLFTWSMREQVYTIASSTSGAPQAACRLCHADEDRPTASSGGILKYTRRL